jgi:hypothetical protein
MVNKVIWKYPLAVGITSINMPFGSRILSLQIQDDFPVMWAEVDLWEAEHKDNYVIRYFCTYGTGHEFSTKNIINYVGTYQLYNAGFVGHVYELENIDNIE